MDKLKAMKIFTRVVETLSFTKAAESLSLPRTTVTVAIQSLESSLDVRLLHRNTRNLSLTAEGTHYYAACLRVLDDLEDTEQAFQHGAKNPKGHIRIEVSNAIARNIIIPKLVEFNTINPNITMAISTGDDIVDLVKNGVDCAIRVGTLQDSSLIVKKVGTLDFIICGSPSYFQNHKIPHNVLDLKEHSAVRYISRQNGRPLDWIININGENTQLDVNSSFSVNDADSYLECGLQGLGLIMPARFMAQHHIASNRLTQVLPELKSPKLPISILYPQRHHLSPKIKIFTEWVASIFEKNAIPLI
ncbi:LysR family transcriptional regulator, regulator for bpeEF and oprC [Serratia sp. CC22-02]|uniref:LysR family transcriptional regulator n=1 Tax=Serratia sp. CC22-02 TaxID=1378076 RepID=UPI0024031B7A|nr:LysR family transcriptional regulator [Serratia sp. CC22-02]SMP59985.1 LysR family transcriptional regulator, regulator for bpeEF and oprC [Serratia sp. CC22-02]